MTRAAHSFGDVAEFTVWAHENAEMFRGTSHSTTAVQHQLGCCEAGVRFP